MNACRTFGDWCLDLFVSIVDRKGGKWASTKLIDIKLYDTFALEIEHLHCGECRSLRTKIDIAHLDPVAIMDRSDEVLLPWQTVEFHAPA